MTRRCARSSRETHHEVTRLLEEHREQLESLTHQALLKAETLDAADAYAAAGVPMGEQAPAPAPV